MNKYKYLHLEPVALFVISYPTVSNLKLFIHDTNDVGRKPGLYIVIRNEYNVKMSIIQY